MAISLGGFSGGGGTGAVTSVNGQTGVVVVSGDDVAADHTASNYTAANANVDGHLSGIDTKLGTLAAGLIYKGTFNATTGLTGSGGNLNNALQGDLYVIDTAGTIYGQTWSINDHLLINADMGGSVTNSKIDKIDNTEPTNVLITTNNLSDLNSASTARTNLGLGTAATANTGTSNGNVVLLDATGLPAVDGSQLTNVTSTDSTKLAIANNLSDLNNAGTARTNLGLGTAATANTGTSNGNVVVLDATGLPAVDGSQLTNVTSTDSSKLAIANNLSDLNSASTARTNLGLGTAATANTGTSNGNVVVLDATGLPAVDGSQLTNVTSTDSSKLAIANNLSDLNNAGTARTNLGLGTAATAASTDFLSATGADTLGGNLDVGTSDIVSSSNNNIEFAADGTGVVKVIPTATGGHLELNGDGTNVGKLRLMCEQSSHGIYLTGPSHSASASYTLKFPNTAGTNNYVLKTDGSGNLDWVAQSGGGSAPSVTTDSSGTDTTISTSTGIEEIHLIDNGASAVVITLPAVATAGTGYKYNIKRLGSGTVTIDANGSETIDGATTFAIGAQNDSITLVAVVQSGTDTWFLI